MKTINNTRAVWWFWFKEFLPTPERKAHYPIACAGALVFCLVAGLNAAESARVLYDFGTNTAGRYPRSKLVQGPDGFLYGTTEFGGASNLGQVYKLKPDGSGYTALKDFAGGDGAFPLAGLVLSGTTLYGTASSGGLTNCGVIFRLQTDGSDYAVIRHFSGLYEIGSCDGGSPTAGLTLADDTLYGTTEYGGAHGNGTVFKLKTDGSGFVVIKDFTSGAGVRPQAGVTLAGATLYGTTAMDAIVGTVYKVNTDGTGFAVLHNFGLQDGANPRSDLVVSGTTLYGTAQAGGLYGYGLVFKINNDGSGFTPLKHFRGAHDGAAPAGGLTLWGPSCLEPQPD